LSFAIEFIHGKTCNFIFPTKFPLIDSVPSIYEFAVGIVESGGNWDCRVRCWRTRNDVNELIVETLRDFDLLRAGGGACRTQYGELLKSTSVW